jgi:hypothetical protein
LQALNFVILIYYKNTPGLPGGIDTGVTFLIGTSFCFNSRQSVVIELTFIVGYGRTFYWFTVFFRTTFKWIPRVHRDDKRQKN